MPGNEQPKFAVHALLDQAYDALLAADLAALPDLTRSLEAELQRAMAGMNGDDLRAIRQKADRNAVVLLAAQRGIRAARRRVEEIRSAASGLVTYDRSGRRAEVGETGALAKRF